MPMRKIWKRNSYFYKPACVGWANSHFFWRAGLPALYARQVLDLICIPWASSAPNPTAKMKYKSQDHGYSGRGPTKSSAALHSDLDIIAWIKSIILIQISPATDQQYLCLKLICLSCQVKAAYCVLPLKSPCISVALCICVTSKLTEKLISIRWKTDLDKSTWQLCILVKKTK